MIGTSRANRFRPQVGTAGALLFTLAGCGHIDAPATVGSPPVVLTMAYGLSSGLDPQSGSAQAANIIASETLIGFTKEGRPVARLAESWSGSPDGLQLRVRLRSGATFHSGQIVTADAVRQLLQRDLPNVLGPGFADIAEIRVPSALDVEFTLKRRSPFVLEALSDVAIQGPPLMPGKLPNGVGPFKVVQTTAQGVEMVANDAYYGGRPFLDRIDIKPYGSVRAAWADMLRGQADMLYEIGPDAIDLLQSSNDVRVLTHQRNYEALVLLNVKRAVLQSPEVRQILNTAIDRDALVSGVLKGHGTPAVGTVWPSHWAYDDHAPVFQYRPRAVFRTVQFTCLIPDPSMERLALNVQRQLHGVGVDMQLGLVTVDEMRKRIATSDFDAILLDAQMGPTLLQPYRSWLPGSGRNWGGYNNSQANAAFDRIRDAADDAAYRAGVAALQRAIFDDPPAIFLTWGERARAISTRFEVPVEPGRDIIGTLRLWRPLSMPRVARRN